eukprot:gene10658-18062_t
MPEAFKLAPMGDGEHPVDIIVSAEHTIASENNEAFRGIRLAPMEIYTYVTILMDVTDGVFDYIFVARLAQDSATRAHAARLGVCTTIAMLLEMLVKTALRNAAKHDTNARLQKGGTRFDHSVEYQFNMYIMYCGLMELIIFFIEDATTLFVWWETGLYDHTDTFAKANLITTVSSAGAATAALIYGSVRLLRSDGKGCDCSTWFYSFFGTLFVAALIFWACFGLTIIQNGEAYGCLAACNHTSGAAGGVERHNDEQDSLYFALVGMLNLDGATYFDEINASLSDFLAANSTQDFLAELQSNYGVAAITTTTATADGGGGTVGEASAVGSGSSTYSGSDTIGWDEEFSPEFNRGVRAVYISGLVVAGLGILMTICGLSEYLLGGAEVHHQPRHGVYSTRVL